MFGFLKKSKDVTNDISNISENTGRQTAAVFVDYEHWFYAYNNIYNLKPNVSEWYDEIKDQYDVKSIKFFGDFSENNIKKELPKLEKITDGIVHTASMKDGVDKDFTDVIILDAIYRQAAQDKSPDVFIIFTGDAHFDYVIRYLREIKKRVLVYGVKKSLSARLRSSANAYVEMPRNSQEFSQYYDMIFSSLSHVANNKKKATYWRTTTNVSTYNKISQDRIQAALDYLIKNRYIIEYDARHNGNVVKILSVDWKKVNADNIWERKKNR